MEYKQCYKLLNFTIMTEEAKQRMWDIDHNAQLGNDISKEDKDFFNAYYEIMLEELEDAYNHFKHHSGKI